MLLRLIPILILLLSMTALGQKDATPSDAARTFLQGVAKGELELAEKHAYKLLTVDGKVFGPESAPAVTAAIKLLSDSGYEYHKELSVDTSQDLARVYVEMIRRMTDHTAVDLYEVLLIRSGSEWKISGWRKISPSIDIPRPPTYPSFPAFPRGIPVLKPCRTCV